MIDVPVQVKEALKEGRLKKNYRFLVENMSGWMTVGSFKCIDLGFPTGLVGDDYKYIIEESGKFKFHINEANYDTYTCYYRTTSNGAWSTLQASDRNTWEYTSTGYVQIEIKRPTESASDIIAVEKYSNGFTRTIDNNNLVSESVNIDERMCSGDVLKFGLCEGSSLEFQYFDFPNITGKRIQAFIDVDYGESTPYSIPMGFFTVKKCSRQASTGIIKATAYNKLQSDYLDAKANEAIIDIVSRGEDGENSVSIYKILEALLNGYSIEQYTESQAEGEGGDGFNVFYASYPTYNQDGTTNGYYLNVAFGSWSVVYDPSSPDYDKYIFATYKTALKTAVNTFLTDIASRYTNNYFRVFNENHSASSYMKLMDAAATLRDMYSIPSFSIGNEVMWGRIASDSTKILAINEDHKADAHRMRNSHIGITIPFAYTLSANQETGFSSVSAFQTYFNNNNLHSAVSVRKLDLPQMDLISMTKAQAEALGDVTLRDLQTAVYESVCQFGQLSRVTDLFSGVELNHSRLYPAANLYPSNSLVPLGAALSTYKSMYSKLWADEGNIHKWRYLIITYKGLNENGQEEDFKLQRTINADGTDDYNMSDNWIFRNLIWNGSDVGNYADAMVSKMRDVTWFPFELWCPGLPYLETGDEIEIELNENSYTSYILQRQLKGIQNIQDTYINGTLDIF